MPRGGYQKPKNPAGASGPGAFSKRTDGQKITPPDLDHPDIQYGDRQGSIDAQRIAKLAGAQGGAGTRSGVPRQAPAGSRGGKLPPWFTQTEDTNPSEPTTAGLDMGPGPGSEILDASQPPEDERVAFLLWAGSMGNPDAGELLNELRAETAARNEAQQPVMTPPVTEMGLEETMMPAGPGLEEETPVSAETEVPL